MNSLMEKNDFKCCWTCLYCMLDIGNDTYECFKTGKVICDRHQRGKVHEPTECEHWKF